MRLLTIFFWLGVVVAPAASTASSPSQLCDTAALKASEITGVPVHTLMTLARVETGRDNAPWPWTMNISGKGYWLESRPQARTLALRTMKSGNRSFDVGCFQINYRWHGQNFSSLAEMFEPDANALYAARFLNALHDELGSWPRAIAAFHSRTPELGRRYLRRFNQISASLKQHEAYAMQPYPVVSNQDNKGASLQLLADVPTRAHLNSLWKSQ